jgi:hypothetical protein
MEIRFVSVDEKYLSQLIDAIRLLAWEQFKLDSRNDSQLKDKDALALYAEDFYPLWQNHEIHKMTKKQIVDMISKLGYSEAELFQKRNNYYEKKAAYKRNQSDMPF